VRLRLSLSTEDFNSVVRYAALLAYDPAAGRAVLALPNAFLCKQVTTRLAFPIATTLSQITGRPVQVHAIVQPAGKQAAGASSAPMRPSPRSALRQSVTGQRRVFGRSN
jgi:chromosomal replication initiation ATPase DnaA